MRGADEFEERFWSGADLAGLFREVTAGGERSHRHREHLRSGIPRIRAPAPAPADAIRAAMLEGAQRGMRVAATREIDRLEQNLEFLANVGSISPYVGLLGTVVGHHGRVLRAWRT